MQVTVTCLLCKCQQKSVRKLQASYLAKCVSLARKFTFFRLHIVITYYNSISKKLSLLIV